MFPFLSFKLFVVNGSRSSTAPQTVKVTAVSWLPKIYAVPKGVRMYWYLFLLKTPITSFRELWFRWDNRILLPKMQINVFVAITKTLRS